MKEELIEYGLSNKEADIFLAALKLGEATANRIAEVAGLARSTTYDILDKLKSSGLISTYVSESKTHFIANNPEILITALDEKKQAIREILPSLKNVYKKIEDKPYAEVFQGKIAIIKILDEILNNAKSLKIIGSIGNALEKIDYHPDKFRIKRMEKKIPIKQILEISKESKQIKRNEYTQIRFLDKLNEAKECIFILEDYVYHIILQYDISAIKIKSKDHVKVMEIIFDELWRKAS